jgi:hypothetical protein
MAVTATPIFPQSLKNTAMTITAAETQTYKTAYTAGTNGSKIEAMFLTSNDTSNRDISINLTISAVNYQLTLVQVPLSAGQTNAIPPVNVLTHANVGVFPLDALGNPFIYLASGTTLTINAPVSLTAAKTVTSLVVATDY